MHPIHEICVQNKECLTVFCLPSAYLGVSTSGHFTTPQGNYLVVHLHCDIHYAILYWKVSCSPNTAVMAS